MKHINRIHQPSHTPVPPDFLDSWRLDTCNPCNILFFRRGGCPSCKGHRQQHQAPPPVVSPINGTIQQAPQPPHTPVPVPLPPLFTFTAHEILTTNVSTRIHVPHGARPAWSHLLSTVYTAYKANPRSEPHYAALIALPKCILFPINRAGIKHRTHAANVIRQRIHQWHEGQQIFLWKSARESASPTTQANPPPLDDPEDDTNDQWRDRVRKAAQEGNIHRAALNLLDESPLLPRTPEVIAALQQLHPPGPPVVPPAASPEVAPAAFTSAQLIKALKSFPRFSAPGPSGLRPAHLLEAITCGSAACEQAATDILLDFCQFAANGSLPAPIATLLCASRLLPFSKKAGGIRPIAVGEVLRRLIGKLLLMNHQPEVVDHLKPAQLGVGVSGAPELIFRGIQHLLHSRSVEPLYLLQLDFRNAFNSIDRSQILQQLQQVAPALVPWVMSTYCTPSSLIVDSETTILSQQGVQQGDPLGPLLFSIAAHPLVKEVASLPGISWSAWFLDDGNLVGTLPALRQVLGLVEAKGPSLGLNLNVNKSSLSGRDVDLSLLTNHDLQAVPFSPPVEGQATAQILGLPLGPTSFLQQAMTKVNEKFDRYHHQLQHLRDPQISLLLLRSSLGIARVTHLMRSIDPPTLQPYLNTFELTIRSTLTFLVGRPLHDSAWQQSGLPINKGGLGISHPTTIAPAAYVSSSLAFYAEATALQLPPSAAKPTQTFRDAAYQLALSSGNPPKLLQLSQAVHPPEIDPDHQDQKFWSDLLHRHQRTQLLSKMTARDRSRLQCQSQPSSGAMLTSTPSPALGLSFAPPEFTCLLRFFLGIPLAPNPSTPSICPYCGGAADIYGDHAVTCRRISYHGRHKFVCDALVRVGQSADFPTDREVAVNGKERPADVLFSGVPNSSPMAIDVTVVHPLADFDGSAEEPTRVQDAEKAKHTKSDALCQAAGLTFRAFGLSTFGTLGPDAREVLSLIRSRLIEAHGKNEGPIRAREAQERISIACLRGVGAQLLSFFASITPIPTPARPLPSPPFLPSDAEDGLMT